MNEKLYEALEDCLIALETGSDVDTALKRFPDMADELRPLLEVSVRARSLASATVPAEAVRRGRARLLQHAVGMREMQEKPSRPSFLFRRLATTLVIALVVFLSGTGLVRASNGALPGDNLYPVKRTWEDVRLAIVVNPESREELETEFERERLEEVDELLSEGRHETIAFAGIVTQRNGNQWIVSGISVQVVDSSQLPTEPVEVGMFVTVEGFTNAQGFVEANSIKLLDFIGFLTPVAPMEIEETMETESHENDALESDLSVEDEQPEDSENGIIGDDESSNSGEEESDSGNNSESDSSNLTNDDEKEDSSGSSNDDSEKEDDSSDSGGEVGD